MPNFPSLTPAGTTNVDNPNDLVANARADIKNNMDNVNSIISTYDGYNLVVTAQSQNFTKQQYFGASALTTDSANAYEWDLDNAQVGTITLSANSSLNSPSNQNAGGTYILIVKQNGTGGYSLTFDGVYKFANGITPAVSTDPNAIDVFTFVSDGSNMLGVAQQDFA
jgi:hypothetical protein